MTPRRLMPAAGLLLALALVSTSCEYLKDKEPWTATVQYRVDDAGFFVVEPLIIEADSNQGLVQVVNDSPVRRGFAIPDLGVFEEIPSGLTINVRVTEAKDGEEYDWLDHLHKEEAEFVGKLIVKYLEDEFRNR